MATKAAIDVYRREPWFHGIIPRKEAEERLDTAIVGTYLFREAETRPGLSLSVRVPDRIKHFMISQNPETLRWQLVGKPTEFKDVFELVTYHGKTPTSTTDGTCLKYPCPLPAGEGDGDGEENPYVDLVNDGQVNQDALDQARRMSEERRASLQQPATTASGKERKGSTTSAGGGAGPHKYEFVDLPGKRGPPTIKEHP